MTIPFARAIEVTRATVFDLERAPAGVTISTDTRTLEPGHTFLALRGERFDGHAYVAEALAKGASAVVIDAVAARIPGHATLVVENTLHAYMALATAARGQFTGRVLGITGSAGKTTTKDLAAQLLAAKYGERVGATPANENNEIGVSKLLLGASNDEQEMLVVEMGARHYGDIATLVGIARPDVAILTNIGDAHLEIMGSPERLAETKWAIFSTGARAVVNARDETTIARAPSLGAPPHWFYAGDPSENVPLYGRVTALVGSSSFVDIDGSRERGAPVDVRLPGAHNRENLAAAAAAALELGVAFEQIAAAIPSLQLPKGRYERTRLRNGVTLIYDAYNANAAGMIAALDAFAQERAGRRIAVLGSMAELGEGAAQLHARVGRHAAATNVDVVLVGGEFATELASGASNGGFSSERIVAFATNAQAARWLQENARAGDAVLLKGSRKYKLEEIVEELQG